MNNQSIPAALDQYFIQQKYRLSAEMNLAVCYIAQDQDPIK
jgi:hypothetical protein